MRKLMLVLLAMILLDGCATIPTNFVEKANSDFNTDIKLYSLANYSPGKYGFRGGGGPSLTGLLCCANDRVLFIITGRQNYDLVLEIKYEDIIDVLVPAYGRSRMLVIKCKSNFYSFFLRISGTIFVAQETTYDFYRFIAPKAGLEIKPGFEKKTKKSAERFEKGYLDTTRQPKC